MVDGSGLENRHTREGIVGSNPTLSAIAPIWPEEPSVIHPGKEYRDRYDHQHMLLGYEGVEGTGWKRWKSINKKMSFPPSARHGGFLQISAAKPAQVMAALPPNQ